MKLSKIQEKIVYVFAIGVSIFLLFAFIGSVWIRHEFRSICQNAQWQYHGDCTQALISQLNDEDEGYRIRNHAIWALGQSGDIRALPVLEHYYTGNIPEREPLGEMISQYELKKAIELTSGGANFPAFIWRILL